MATIFTLFRAESPEATVRAHTLGAMVTAAAALGLLMVFHDAAASFVQIWTSSVIYGHGMLIPLLAGYLAYQRRARALQQPARPAVLLGGAGLALAGLIWLAGDVTETQILEHVGLVGMLQSTVLAILGHRITLVLAVPLVYLVLAIPFGESVVPLLQDMTAQGTTKLLRATGVPVHMADWKLITPDGAFLVARVCAGLQYILACLAIGGLIAGIWYRTPWKRLIILVLALAVPIGANVLRAYGIVMLAHLVSFEAASGVAHVIYGFIFLSVISLGFILLAARFREPGVPATAAATPGPSADDASRGRGARLALAAGVTIALALGIKGTAGVLAAPADGPSPVPMTAPVLAGAWQPHAIQGEPWRPKLPQASTRQQTWAFTNGERRVSVTVAQFADTGRGSDVIGGSLVSPNDDSVQVTARGRADAAAVREIRPPAYVRVEPRGQHARLVWYWYAVGGQLTGNPVTGKLYQLLARVSGDESAPRLIMLSTRESDDDTAKLSRFVADLDLARLAASTPTARK